MKQYKLNTHLISGYRKDEEIPKEVRDDLISEGCPESWFSPVEEEWKIGDWMKVTSGTIFRITDIKDGMEFYGYGIDGEDNEWFDEDYVILYTGKVPDCMRKATKDEIETALIAEAKRRGFICNLSNVVKFKPIKVSNIKVRWEEKEPEIRDSMSRKASVGGTWVYDPDTDTLINSGWGGVHAVYHKGKWAEIVDEPIQINGYEAEFKDGYVQFGCAKIDNRFFTQMAEQIDSTDLFHKKGKGNRSIKAAKIGEGLFTLEDIKKIAKRIES